MSINLTDEIEVKTKKGKLGAAKQIFLEGDTQTVEKEIQDINSRHNTLNTKHESLSKTVQGIAATGGASTANNVTYNNDRSELNAENAQDAIDELKSSIADETTRAKAAEEAILFDVSAHNNGATFESLSALLNSSDLSTLIPTSSRHGGMSIRFIQSSDNKYVQYRLMSKTFSITESDWQGDTKLLDRIYDLEEKAEKGVIGGYKILEWKTDIATTRKQVPLQERKQGLLISYKNQDGIIVNEQYNIIKTSDVFWEMDTSWKKIDYLSVAMLKRLLINENDNYIGVSEIHEDGKFIDKNGNLSINSKFAISKAILVKKGTYIFFNNYENDMGFPGCSYLAKTDESQSTYTSLVTGAKSKVEAYLVTEDMYVAFSFPKNVGLNIEFYSLGYHIKDIYDKLEENANRLSKTESYGVEPFLVNTDGNGIFEVKGNGFISNGQENPFPRSDFQISKAIFIRKGTLVYAKATQDVYKHNIITETDADYSFYKDIFISTPNKITEYSFIADKDMYIMFGWYSKSEHIFKYALPGEMFKNNIYLNNLCLEVALSTFSKAIAIGDSVTQGATVDYPRVYKSEDVVQPQYSYTVTTAKILQWDITNAGITGITPIGWYNSMFSKYTYTDYDIAIIELGWNDFDGDFETDVRPFGENYESYAQTQVGYYCRIVQNIKVLNPNIFIVLVASSGWSTRKVGYNEKVETIAEYFGCGIIVLDRNTIEDLQQNKYHGLKNEGGTIDYVHFTRAGYMMKGIVMAKELNRVLFDNLVKINNERKYVL